MPECLASSVQHLASAHVIASALPDANCSLSLRRRASAALSSALRARVVFLRRRPVDNAPEKCRHRPEDHRWCRRVRARSRARELAWRRKCVNACAQACESVCLPFFAWPLVSRASQQVALPPMLVDFSRFVYPFILDNGQLGGDPEGLFPSALLALNVDHPCNTPVTHIQSAVGRNSVSARTSAWTAGLPSGRKQIVLYSSFTLGLAWSAYVALLRLLT